MENKRLLVLDDEPNITLLTSSLLALYGYDVTECNDPLEALNIVRNQQFDLILVDIMMPTLTGIEFMEKAQQIELNKYAQYAVLTAKILDEDERKSIFQLGAEIITKPFIPQELVDKIRDMLGTAAL